MRRETGHPVYIQIMTAIPSASRVLGPADTAAALPYPALVKELARLLRDDTVHVPPRMVLSLPGGGSLFVMPAHDARVAITKLITFTPANAGTNRPAIQGDVVVFDVATGARALVLDGPTVTARRTAAVSALAAQHLAPHLEGSLLIIGAGVQGRTHLDAFADCLGVREVVIASRSQASAEALARHARSRGLAARTTRDPDAALADCPLVVTCTPASGVVLRALPGPGHFIAAVGAFTPTMVELSPELCRHVGLRGRVVVDTGDATHEAGDLLQAGLEVSRFETLQAVVTSIAPGAAVRPGPVLFKSCGWAGWDLAAARLGMA